MCIIIAHSWHHESIVSREVWDEAERIRMKRSKNKIMETSGNRERYTRQYAFSSMCECSYCGHKLTRRTRHSSSIYEKPVWQCMNATKNGIKNCPHCKAIDEAILEGAFLEAFGLLAGNFDDVLDIVMSNVEEALNNAEDVRKKQQLDKDISSLESKKSRMTDMLIDGTISKEVYDEKVLEFTRKLHTLSERRHLLEESISKQKDVGKRMSALRETLSHEQVLDEFDRVVFESIIEKVLVGGFDEEGNPDPYKLTFVLKGNQSGTVPNAKERYKATQNELKKGNKDADTTKPDTPPTYEEPEDTTPPADDTPKTGDTKDGMVYVEGFGWLPDEGAGSGTNADDMYENGNKVGIMD